MTARLSRLIPLAALLFCIGSAGACMTFEDAYPPEPQVIERLSLGSPSNGEAGAFAGSGATVGAFEHPPTAP